MELVDLDVLDYTGQTRWRWRLTEPGGAFVADHTVCLDERTAEYEAFADLYRYLRWNAAPDRRRDSETEILAWLGRWIGEEVLSKVGPAIVARAPVTVRVRLPAEAAALGCRPLELAWVDGRPLALQQVSLVIQGAGGAGGGGKRPVGERLRMLAVFSLPVDAAALSLRRERYELARLVDRIAQVNHKTIELRVLQYGVTRERLDDVLLEDDGWDVVHISGHGLPAGLLLETADGSRDLISSTELVDLLDPARAQIKLVTLSACESAAATAAEHLRLLGIPVRSDDTAPRRGEPLPALAAALVDRLGCAVLAMRYPVDDEFAITLGAQVYELMLGKGHPLPRALRTALPRLCTGASSTSPLSVATPALFGPLADQLRLLPPAGGPLVFDVANVKLADFPPQPVRFVGRVGPMARATAALAPDNEHSAVLFHGHGRGGQDGLRVGAGLRPRADLHPPGVAQGARRGPRHHRRPDQPGTGPGAPAPRPGNGAGGGRHRRAASVPAQADPAAGDQPGPDRVGQPGVAADRAGRLARPTLGAGRQRAGQPRRLSRVVLTSRRRPAMLDPRARVEAIHALSLEEAMLVARELPNLRALFDSDTGRALLSRTLAVVQGHPKLIELADGQATDHTALAARLDEADQAWLAGSTRLQTFFDHGESAATDDDFVRVLSGWTRAATGALPEPARILFHFLCALEEHDRRGWIVEANWADLWERLERPGDPPDLQATLVSLVGQGLVVVEPGDDQDRRQDIYHLHPGVAEAGQAAADPDFQAAVDTRLAAFWKSGFGQRLAKETHAQGWMVRQSGRSVASYLLRLGEWDTAAWVLETVLNRDHSPGTVAAVLPLLRRVVEATTGTEDELDYAALLARALSLVQPAEAETRLRELLAEAVARDRFATATILAGNLINLLRDTGRLDEALAMVEQKSGYTRRAGLGPWTQLADEARQLQILVRQGRSEEVLSSVQKLWETMAALPQQREANDPVNPWNVREAILSVGRSAAAGQERWEEALALNAALIKSTRRRSAPPLELADIEFNDYGPLLRLGRINDAKKLLLDCRAVFEQEKAIGSHGQVVGALADVEDRLGHRDAAVRLQQDALRYAYAATDPEPIAGIHQNLASYLRGADADPAVALAHRLASAIIQYQTGAGLLALTLDRLARDLASFITTPPLPASFAVLCGLVGRVEGVQLAQLFERLPRRAPDGDAALAEVLRLARQRH
ncbi:MAG: CHAT domain-containing protein [Egibacteraceae bacterium]